jgi:hypothetical protein
MFGIIFLKVLDFLFLHITSLFTIVIVFMTKDWYSIQWTLQLGVLLPAELVQDACIGPSSWNGHLGVL